MSRDERDINISLRDRLPRLPSARRGFRVSPEPDRQIDDDEQRHEARRQTITADVFFGSPNVIASTGEIVGVNGKGTSLGVWPYAAKELVLVSGTNKIVPTLDDVFH